MASRYRIIRAARAIIRAFHITFSSQLFSRKAAQQLFPSLRLTTWVFDVELLIMAQILEIPVAEVPIVWHEVSGSKLSLVSDSLGMLKDLIILRTNYALGTWSVDLGKAKRD